MSKKLTDMINEFDDSLQEKPVEVVAKSEEPVKEPEAVEPEAVEEPTVEEPKAEEPTVEEPEKAEEAEESTADETVEKSDKASEKAKEDKAAEKEDEKDEETEKSDDDEEDEDKGKKKAEVKKSDEPQEEVLKSSDIIGAFEVVFKGLQSVIDQQSTLIKNMNELATTQSELIAKSVETKEATEVVEKSVDAEDLTKVVEDISGKAVSFVEKSVEPAEVVAEPVVEAVVTEPEVELPVSVQAHKMRDAFMARFKEAAADENVSKNDLYTARAAWNSFGNGVGTEKELQVVKDFIGGSK